MQREYSPDEFRRAQDTLDLSDSQLAHVLGVSTQHVRRLKVRDIESGSSRRCIGSTALLLSIYLSGYRPPDWPN